MAQKRAPLGKLGEAPEEREPALCVQLDQLDASKNLVRRQAL
jgi:hypothetical protein